MVYQHFFEYFLLGAAGAGAAELLKVYDLRNKWDEPKFAAALRSSVFWMLVVSMLAASGFVAWAVNSSSELGPWQVVLSGIGARGLIRGPTQAATSRQKMKLGDEPKAETFSLRDFFA